MWKLYLRWLMKRFFSTPRYFISFSKHSITIWGKRWQKERVWINPPASKFRHFLSALWLFGAVHAETTLYKNCNCGYAFSQKKVESRRVGPPANIFFLPLAPLPTHIKSFLTTTLPRSTRPDRPHKMSPKVRDLLRVFCRVGSEPGSEWILHLLMTKERFRVKWKMRWEKNLRDVDGKVGSQQLRAFPEAVQGSDDRTRKKVLQNLKK